ncbi:MAG: hypothetical protein EA349_05255 [Halomonadaceae bacterium]|nr:MAG: hypothetical protein EA349_05255 [Halomonadaceae bacterium]
MSGPDKPKVFDEPWGDERIRGFLFLSPYDTAKNADYHVLLKAYHAMRIGEFQRFLTFFNEAERNLNAVNDEGETILDRVGQHVRCKEYADALKAAGAKSAKEAGASA